MLPIRQTKATSQRDNSVLQKVIQERRQAILDLMISQSQTYGQDDTVQEGEEIRLIYNKTIREEMENPEIRIATEQIPIDIQRGIK